MATYDYTPIMTKIASGSSPIGQFQGFCPNGLFVATIQDYYGRAFFITCDKTGQLQKLQDSNFSSSQIFGYSTANSVGNGFFNMTPTPLGGAQYSYQIPLYYINNRTIPINPIEFTPISMCGGSFHKSFFDSDKKLVAFEFIAAFPNSDLFYSSIYSFNTTSYGLIKSGFVGSAPTGTDPFNQELNIGGFPWTCESNIQTNGKICYKNSILLSGSQYPAGTLTSVGPLTCQNSNLTSVTFEYNFPASFAQNNSEPGGTNIPGYVAATVNGSSLQLCDKNGNVININGLWKSLNYLNTATIDSEGNIYAMTSAYNGNFDIWHGVVQLPVLPPKLVKSQSSLSNFMHSAHNVFWKG